MELRHLRYFIAVATTGSFGRAAERLHVSQPALSQQIRDLEAHVGTPLLERHPRGASLTPAGQTLLPLAERLIGDARAAVMAARGAAETVTGTLVVGLPETNRAVTEAKRLLQALALRFPSVGFVTTGLPWLEHPTALGEERIDIGFSWSGGPRPEARYVPGIASLRLFEDPGEYALLGRAHPLASRRDLTVERLDATPFALFPRELHPPFFDHLVAGLRAHGLNRVDTALGVGSASTSVPLIIASGGWTIVSRLVGRESLPGAVARRLRGVSIDAGLDVIWRSDDVRPHVRALPEMVQALRQP